MSFKQPDLPYALGALQPFLHEEQMNYHYNKHQAAYFAKLNTLLEGKPEANAPLKEVIVAAAAGPGVQQLPPRHGTTISSGTACRPPAAATPRATC